MAEGPGPVGVDSGQLLAMSVERLRCGGSECVKRVPGCEKSFFGAWGMYYVFFCLYFCFEGKLELVRFSTQMPQFIYLFRKLFVRRKK